jgi:hypothetical protein
MRKWLAAGALLSVVLDASPAAAWGFVGHQLIMRRAIDLLPAEIKPFFERHREEVVMRVIDPDLWRTLGWPEDPNHFMDFGVKEYGAFPFLALPREYGAALAKFGPATLDRNGRLPWRLDEMAGTLRREFEALPRNAPYTLGNIVLFSGVSSHYLQDAHQPFHATEDYDGVAAGQRGIHSRFERDLIERFGARLTLNPAPVTPITAPRDAAFEVLLSGHQLVDRVFRADREAAEGRSEYDDVYFERFFDKVRPILEERLSMAISATAGLITGAWVQAGRPLVRFDEARPPQRIDRGR